MAKVQLRKSLSVSPRGYLELQRIANSRGISISGTVERLAKEEAERVGITVDEAQVKQWIGRERFRRSIASRGKYETAMALAGKAFG